MPIAVGATSISDVRIGTTPADKVYLGDVLVWQRIFKLGLIKTNTQNGTGTSWLNLNGLAEDPALPGWKSVNPAGAAALPDNFPSYTARIDAAVYHTGGSSPLYGQTRVFVNGAVVATGSQVSSSPGTSTVTWTGTLKGGDAVSWQWRGEGNFFTRPTAQSSGTWLTVTPV